MFRRNFSLRKSRKFVIALEKSLQSCSWKGQ